VAKAIGFDDHSVRQLKQTAKDKLDTHSGIQIFYRPWIPNGT